MTQNEEACNAKIYWWDGEYDDNCELPKNHLEPFHYDGNHYFDDDNNQRDDQQERLEAYIAKHYISKDEILKARPDPLDCEMGYDCEPNRGICNCKSAGHNQALKDWSKAMGIGETE